MPDAKTLQLHVMCVYITAHRAGQNESAVSNAGDAGSRYSRALQHWASCEWYEIADESMIVHLRACQSESEQPLYIQVDAQKLMQIYVNFVVFLNLQASCYVSKSVGPLVLLK